MAGTLSDMLFHEFFLTCIFLDNDTVRAALLHRFDFHTGPAKPTVSTFAVSKAVEFWALTGDGTPDMAFRVANLMEGSCQNDVHLSNGVTGDTQGQWSRFYFDLSKFGCTGKITIQDLNRVQWENRGSSNVSLCVNDIRLVPADQQSAVASAG